MMSEEAMAKAPWEKSEEVEPMAQLAELADKPKQEDLLQVETGDLTEEEKKQVLEYARTIDLANTKGIVEFGSGVQKKMAGFSENILQSVKTKDLGAVGDMLQDVVVDLRDFNPGEKQSGGLFGLFRKPEKKMAELKAQYDSAAGNVDKVAAALRQHQIKLLKDVDIMDRMYASNLDYYKELNMYIMAGKQKIAMVRNEELPSAKAKAEASGNPEDAQAAKDIEDQLTRFEKKVHDLELTRMVAIQTAPQIRMIQNNDTMMVEKIQSTIVNTIPLWKNQMVLAMGLNDSVQAAKAEAEVTEMTNQLLLQNAEALKQSTIETAKASERGIVDMETLKKTNESLISTLDEVAKIQADGRAARTQAEAELRVMEDTLKKKLLQMRGDDEASVDGR
jgi:uncharacterized protein YaaN involved in tellurite resistance